MSTRMNARSLAFPTEFSPLDVKELCTTELVQTFSNKLARVKEWSGPQFEVSDDIYAELPQELASNPARACPSSPSNGNAVCALPPFRNENTSVYELFAVIAHANGDPE